MAKAKDKPVEAVAYDTDGRVKPIDQLSYKSSGPEVDTVLVVDETPPGVVLPRWRVRPKGSETWQDVEAETVEDAIRAFNGRGNVGKVFPFKQLDIERL